MDKPQVVSKSPVPPPPQNRFSPNMANTNNFQSTTHFQNNSNYQNNPRFQSSPNLQGATNHFQATSGVDSNAFSNFDETVIHIKSPLITNEQFISRKEGEKREEGLYSFYQAEYYRDYFSVTTKLVLARLTAAMMPWLDPCVGGQGEESNILLLSSSRQRNLRKNWSPNKLARFSRAGTDFYGWFWVFMTATFWLFFAKSLEQSYLLLQKDGGLNNPNPIVAVSYDLTDLWLAFCLLAVGHIGWPLLAAWFQPSPPLPGTFPEAELALGNVESQSQDSRPTDGWRFWVMMYGYTRASLVWYTIVHFFIVLVFGQWTSSWLAAIVQWMLLFVWILTDWCFLLNESYPFYFPQDSAPGNGGVGFVDQLKNIPLNYHFCFLLVFEGLLLLFIALSFVRF